MEDLKTTEQINVIDFKIKQIKKRLLLKTNFYEETILKHQIIDLLFKKENIKKFGIKKIIL